MTTQTYDAIVIGARCAGSPTAMLLARKGHRVLVVDRATFPSDTVSTHLVHPQAVAALARWGLLDALVASGCPPIHTYAFDFGPIVLAGSPAIAGSPVSYCPRRTVLDRILVDAAREAGAEVREGFAVEELVWDGDRVTGLRGHGPDGALVTVRAPVVIGADGAFSMVARAVQAETYEDRGPLQCCYYAYWSGVPQEGRFEGYLRDHRAVCAMPTHDGQTLVLVAWPIAEFEAQKRDLEASYQQTIELVPAMAARLAGATRVSRVTGMAVQNRFRKPYGPGWVLVGDAGFVKDPCTAQGIVDSFRDAEAVSEAIDAVLTGRRPFDEVMAAFHAERDAHARPIFEFTCTLATLAPPPPEMQQLLGAIAGNQPAMDAFIRVNTGAMTLPELLAGLPA